MLVAQRALEPLLADLQAAADACAALADRHRDTLVTGRTLLQQALPTSFGLVAAGWLAGLDRAGAPARRRPRARPRRAARRRGRHAGRLRRRRRRAARRVRGRAGPGRAGPALAHRTHPDRRPRRRARRRGGRGRPRWRGTSRCSAQTEVGELAEGGAEGGSSTLPHKHNPIGRDRRGRGRARRRPGWSPRCWPRCRTSTSGRPAPGTRSGGRCGRCWRAPAPLPSAARVAAGLRVDAGRMRSNLDRSAATLLAERVAGALRPALGAEAAHAVVREAAAAGTLAGDPRITAHLSPDRLAELLDPAGYLGSTAMLIDRALAAAGAPGDDTTAPAPVIPLLHPAILELWLAQTGRQAAKGRPQLQDRGGRKRRWQREREETWSRSTTGGRAGGRTATADDQLAGRRPADVGSAGARRSPAGTG